MKITVFYKFVLFVVVTGSAIGFIATRYTLNQQEKFIDRLYLDRANSQAHSFVSGVTESDLENPKVLRDAALKLIYLSPEIRKINVYKLEGELPLPFVTTANSLDPTEVERHAVPIEKAVKNGETSVYRDVHNGVEDLEIIAPLNISGKTFGVVNLVISLSTFTELKSSQNRTLVILLSISLFVLVAATGIFVRLVVSNPLSKMTKMAEAVKTGNFDIEPEVRSRDEVGHLAKAFTEMARKLKYSYTELEERVKEKTKALSEALGVSEKQNKDLEQTKFAMMNVLEDAKILEGQLKEEKASVEQKVITRTKELSEAKDSISQGWYQLQQEKARLVGAINSFTSAFILTDTDGSVLLHNQVLEKIFGVNIENWSLNSIQKLLGTDFDLIASFDFCVKRRKPTFVKEVLAGTKYLEIFLAPVLLKDGGDKLVGIVIVISDITEEKLLDRSKDEFFSIASHELRTPLTAIKGNTSMILDYFGAELKDPEMKEMISDIHESSLRLIDIVNDFLNVSRLEQGKMVFKPESFDVSVLIADALKEYQVTGSRQKLRLSFTKPAFSVPAVFADKERVRQVIINLVGNGLKFAEEGGVTVSVGQSNDFVNVYVTDTGRGIPLKNQPLLFHKFQQAGSSLITRDTTKGTGLGLYISKLIVEGMKGRIWLEKSEVGKGSTFAFSLPIAIRNS